MPAAGSPSASARRPAAGLPAALGLGPRLTGAFLLVSLAWLAAGAAGLLGLARAASAARLLDQSASMVQLVQEVRVALAGLAEAPASYLAAGDPAASDRFTAAVEQARARLAEYSAAHSLHQHSTQHAAEAHTLAAQAAADLEAAAGLGRQILAGPGGPAGAQPLAELVARTGAASAGLEALLANAQEDIAAARAEQAAAQRAAMWGVGLSALLAVALALGLAWYSTRRLTGPLAELSAAAGRMSAGDLGTPVPQGAPGELGRLAAAFEHLRRMLIHERDRARRLAILEERDRIGREMHDGLAQVLGFVNTKAQAVREFIRAGDTREAGHQVEELIGAAREAYTEARQAISDLRMEDPGEPTLAAWLEAQLERFRRQSGVAAELVTAPEWREPRLSATARAQLARLVQEALANVRKHAAASQVTVGLGQDHGQACLQVADNGRGFALSRLLSPEFSRYGLRTMRERAQAIGGVFRIESMPGAGSRIVVTFPPEAEADE
jgi:signal transduction histidine kinase